jgi:hypothetical protein
MYGSDLDGRVDQTPQFIMKSNMTAIERAFEIARSGRVTTVDAIRAQLKREGYEQGWVAGRALVSQLRGIIGATQGPKQPSD